MKSKSNLPKGTARLFLLQTAMTAIVTAVLFLLNKNGEAVSALLGGVVAILPSVVFARFLFRYQGARSAKKIVNNFYLGEAAKMALSILLFAVVFQFYRVAPIVFFVTYCFVAITSGFLLLIIDNNKG